MDWRNGNADQVSHVTRYKGSVKGNEAWTRLHAEASSGGALRDFSTLPKASKSERNRDCSDRNGHPCVKPIALMSYLIRLVTPPGGTILDPFIGSGTTAVAAITEGFNIIGMDMTEEYVTLARQRALGAFKRKMANGRLV